MFDSPLMAEYSKPLREIFDQVALHNIVGQLIKTKKYEPSSNAILFDPVEYSYNGVNYIIDGEWVQVNDIIKYSNSSCRKCNSKGYYVVEIAKNKLPNPQDYVILSRESLADMSEDQKKLWIEKEKKSTTWRIMMPCQCAIKRLLKVDDSTLAVGDGNMMIRVKCRIVTT